MNRNRFLIWITLLVLISAAAVGCAVGSGDPTEAAAVQPSPESTETADPPPTEALPITEATRSVTLEGKFDVGGYRLFLQCRGAGGPTVILESNLPNTSEYWMPVQTAVAKETMVCRYERAGKGRSDRSPISPRSSDDLADDLYALLIAAEIPGPYVLAGHSFGGLIILQYADRYPDEVAGIVLVDSLTAITRELDQQLEEEFDYQIPGYDPVFEGRVDLEASFASAASVDTLGDVPLVVLSSSNPWLVPGTPDGFSERARELWTEAQLDFLELTTNSRHVMVDQTSVANIVSDGSSEVSGAILDVVFQFRGE